MSLRFRLNFIIFLSIGMIVLVGTVLVISNARQSVRNEIESTAYLADRLIESEFSKDHQNVTSLSDWLASLRNLSQSRHLKIHIEPLVNNLKSPEKENLIDSVPGVPGWFVWSVAAEPLTVIKEVEVSEGRVVELMIQADPRDEIAEAWGEALDFFGLIAVMALIVFILVSITVDRAFKPVTIIIDGLERLKSGSYQERLPKFSLPEFTRIAEAINHTAKTLESASRDNDALRQHSLAVREQERQYLAQELHDEFGQSLSAIKVVAASLKNQCHDDTSQLAINSIRSTCDHLFSVLRTMMRQLHPLILDELGLKASLEDMLEVLLAPQPQVTLHCEIDTAADEYQKDKQIHVFRIVQECLTNILKHAQATEVSVQVKLDSGELKFDKETRLVIQVRDNGSGFDLKSVKHSFGLRGIQERVDGLGGTLAIDSAIGEGVSINISIPFYQDCQ